MKLKNHESPRYQGRNIKSKKAAARLRQLRKKYKQLKSSLTQ